MRLRFELFISRPAGVSFSDRGAYVVVKSVTLKTAKGVLGDGLHPRSFFHRWDDGYSAQVAVRTMLAAERAPRDQRFMGYDWMIDNILAYQQTEKPA